jgi:hypothetical protein
MTRTKEITSLCLLLVAATTVRLLLAVRVHVATIDTAVVGQMATNIINGARPLFFAGQNYMGALEAYVLAAIFSRIPPGHATMTLATIGFTLAWIVTTYLFFRKQYGCAAALAAATIPAIPGWTPVWYTTAPYGGYPQTYLFGMILLLLGLPFWHLQPTTRKRYQHALALGVVAGLGVWTNLQIVPYLAAAGFAGLLAWKRNPRPLSSWLPYLFVPLLIMIAFLPQFLVEPAHTDPPMFDGFSWEAIRRSWRGLWAHDLPHCLLWTYPPRFIHVITIALLSTLIVGAVVMTLWNRYRKQLSIKSSDILVWTMLAVFAVTYFPHPMSGFVPRYLVAPLMLLMSWAIAMWGTQVNKTLRYSGWLIAVYLLCYNSYGIWHAAEVRAPRKTEEIRVFSSIIETARESDWPTIMHIGSEVEGYDAARLTFASGGSPIFSSAFGDRFLAHQFAWEISNKPVFLVQQRALPFVKGSYESMQADAGQIVNLSPYALVENPPVQRQQEFEVLPTRISDYPNDVDQHPLFDRSNATRWPDTKATPESIVMEFDPPVLLAGLRTLAASPLELPYRYQIRTRRPDQSWRDVQSSEQRIAASYLSGTHVYFRGFHPWMDIRFPAHEVTALEWRMESGPANPTTPQLSHLFLLTTNEQAWPPLESNLHSIFAMLQEYPAAQLITERGILRLLHEHGQAHAIDNALLSRVPKPYNPRFSGTLSASMPLPKTEILLILDDAYGAEAYLRIQAANRSINKLDTKPPFSIYWIAPHGPESYDLYWQGFTVVYPGSNPGQTMHE